MSEISISAWLSNKKIWICSEAIDFRKQINGLINIVIDDLEKRPNDGSLYLFKNRQANKIKMLFWDRNGYFVGYKRLEKGRFDFPRDEMGALKITPEELFNLVSGMPVIWLKANKKKIYHY